jgi:hypothetical protein
MFRDNRSPEIIRIASGTAIGGVNFVLPAQPGHKVGGRLRLPGPGARGAVALVLREQPSLAVAMVLTDSEGSFELDGIAPGAYELMASAPAAGYGGFGAVLGPEPAFARRGIDVAGDLAGIDVSLEPGRTVAFSLQSSEGCPPAASAVLQPVENWGALLERKFDVAGGKPAPLRGLAPGRYRAAVTDRAGVCFGAQDRILDFRAVEAAQIEIVRGGSVEGRVEAGGEGPPVAALTALDEPGITEQLAVPDGEGRFVFPQLRPGRYRVRAGSVGREISVSSNASTRVALSEEHP